MDCHQFEEIAGAYALGAVGEQERREAELHLATCDKCQQLLHELQTVTDLLPLAVPAIQPSPRLKTRIMALVRADAEEQRMAMATRQPRRSLSWWRYWQTQVALALILLLLLLSGSLATWNVTLHQQLAGISTTQGITYSIQGTSQVAGVKGEAVYLPQLRLTLLTVYNLPPLKGKEVYQGWLITKNHPQSLGLLQIQNGAATLTISDNIRNADDLAVSREPGPQASQGGPIGPIVAIGSLYPHRVQRAVQENLAIIEEIAGRAGL
jgi:anti-sigma-K factor RskA